MLLSAGVLPPTDIFVHGFVTVDGRKVGKSLGNAIDPIALAERYGTDVLRYYLLREIPASGDGNFSLERLVRAYNADLADQLGNLLSRTVSMISRYYGGITPTPGELEAADRHLVDASEQLYQRLDAALEQFALDVALGAIWDLVAVANKYVVEVQPWALAKQRADPAIERRLATTLYNLVETLRLVAHGLAAFLPATAEAIACQLGIALATDDALGEVLVWGRYPAGTAVQPGAVLFPKIEVG
jgi:methionyl-tRNA synthetase